MLLMPLLHNLSIEIKRHAHSCLIWIQQTLFKARGLEIELDRRRSSEYLDSCHFSHGSLSCFDLLEWTSDLPSINTPKDTKILLQHQLDIREVRAPESLYGQSRIGEEDDGGLPCYSSATVRSFGSYL
ncbi:hypothetical protein VTN31DRAFT_5695 [Thermomyces dupontii]|uniref:uncharacterized protein n=1 Tax=Talaromyces thermophilus TaxID=28565 RepID=UPI0037440C96